MVKSSRVSFFKRPQLNQQNSLHPPFEATTTPTRYQPQTMWWWWLGGQVMRQLRSCGKPEVGGVNLARWPLKQQINLTSVVRPWINHRSTAIRKLSSGRIGTCQSSCTRKWLVNDTGSVVGEHPNLLNWQRCRKKKRTKRQGGVFATKL